MIINFNVNVVGFIISQKYVVQYSVTQRKCRCSFFFRFFTAHNTFSFTCFIDWTICVGSTTRVLCAAGEIMICITIVY